MLAVLFVIFSGNQPRVGMNVSSGIAMRSISESAPSADADFFAADLAESQKEYTIFAGDNENLGSTAAEVEQKVIKTADLEIEVDSAAETAEQLATLATEQAGFVQSSSVSEDSYGNKRGYITIRVPAASFENSLEDIKAMADKVVSENTNGQDVTEEYTDLEARLGAAEAQEAQYLTILTTAKTVGEVLAVQEHLSEVRSEIESLKGQINYLENRTSMSTISVSLLETSRITLPTDKFDFGDEVRDAIHTLVVLLQNIVTAIIWIIIIGGPIAIVGFVGYKIVNAIRRRR